MIKAHQVLHNTSNYYVSCAIILMRIVVHKLFESDG